MGVLELIQQKAFIGKEFLTWLWYRAETDPAVDLPGGRRCELELLGPIVLDAHYGDALSTTLRGDSPATAPEAATALVQGKKLRRARIKLSSDGVDWIATLDGDNLSVSGLNLPRGGRLPFDEALRLRLDFLLEFEGLVDALFNLFLELRLDAGQWKTDLKQIQAWVAGK
jgi:hypothetical protein